MRIIIIALILSGCANINQGRDIDYKVIESFQYGVTTLETVKSTIGEPRVTQTFQTGMKMVIYTYQETKVRGLIGLGGHYNATIKTVALNFDKNDILQSTQYNSSNYGNK